MVPPVLEKGVAEVGGAVGVEAYMQEAFSLVETASTTAVVPAASVPAGESVESTGGVGSVAGIVVKEVEPSVEIFPAVSRHFT